MRASRALRAGLPILVLLSACSSGDPEPTTWFVHATDPHLFEEPEYAELQEPANERTFLSLLETLDALPDSDAEPAFLLLTGDIGFGEKGEGDDGSREGRARRLAAMLSTRARLTVYWVPGNNDVTAESPTAEIYAAAHEFVADVQRRVKPVGVSLHDLTACFLEEAAAGGSCTADVAGTPFRLIGFPTFSFKPPKAATTAGDATRPPPNGSASGAAAGSQTAAGPGATAAPQGTTPAPATGEATTPTTGPEPISREERDRIHLAWTEKLGGLVSAARRDGRRVLLATHISDLNDPYHQARGTVAEIAGSSLPPADTGRPAPWTAWGVPREVFDKWREIVRSPAVARVLAGHFHDSHKEIYRAPYTWEHDPTGVPVFARADRGKTWLAPPLGIRLQADSPIQARGFALVGLSGTDAQRRLYWYDQVANAFTPETPSVTAGEAVAGSGGHRYCWPDFASPDWLWALGNPGSELGKAAVVAVALLFAFLTVVAVWQIPPTHTPLSESSEDPKANAKSQVQPPAVASAFTSNFSRTVLSGLAGMAGVVVLDDMWKDSRLDKVYYLVCFVVLFLLLLVLSAFVRGLVEALRSRVAARPYQFVTRPSEFPSGFVDLLRRFWAWLLSLRTSFLIFFDTTLNVLQGKNQLETKVLGDTILDLQKSLVSTVDRIAEELQIAVRKALARKCDSVGMSSCRVNISVLDHDEKSLSYVSLGRGSLLRRFEQRSVAWIAVFALEGARWWRKLYTDQPTITLYDNSHGKLKGWEKDVKLQSCFQARRPLDYEAFVVLPLPWFRGGREKSRGAIHISFAKEVYLDALWDGLDDDKGCPRYEHGRRLLELCKRQADTGECKDDALAGEAADETENQDQRSEPCIRDPLLRVALIQALAVLPEVLREFNGTVFQQLIKPRG